MQQVFTEKEQVVIYADLREMNSKITAMLREQCIVREQQLDTGDYLLSERVCAERKTTQDFVQSIIDGRLFKQLAELKDTFEKPLLILEGGDLFRTMVNIHPNALRGALASIAVEYALPTLWTKDQRETAAMLYMIAKREQLTMKKSVSLRPKQRFRSENQMQEFLVCGLPDIGLTTAKTLLKHFGTPQRLFTADETALRQADGVGEKTAKQIRRILTKKYEKSILED